MHSCMTITTKSIVEFLHSMDVPTCCYKSVVVGNARVQLVVATDDRVNSTECDTISSSNALETLDTTSFVYAVATLLSYSSNWYVHTPLCLLQLYFVPIKCNMQVGDRVGCRKNADIPNAVRAADIN